MITMDVVPGVHAVTSAATNLYVVQDQNAGPDGQDVMIVDAGLPRMWSETTAVLHSIARSSSSSSSYDHATTSRNVC